MRVAVVGAGIVGVTTAHALHEDGHEVTVFERQGSVATESSFANAGWLAPGYVTPWASPGMLRKVLGQWLQRDAAVRLAGLPGTALAAWLWRWWRACHPRTYAANRAGDRESVYFYYCWSLALAFRALDVRQFQVPAGQVRWAELLVDELLKRQQADGSWVNPAVAQRENDPLVATAEAMAALTTCRTVLAR